MLPLATLTANRPSANPLTVSLYAGIATAVPALAAALLYQPQSIILSLTAWLLIGAGPVVGYQMATGKLGSDWKSLIGGILGFVLLILGFILWPILVGALTKGQSIGKLFVGSLIGFILGLAVLLIAASSLGQDPSWIGLGFVLLWSVWGGTAGAIMTAWGE